MSLALFIFAGVDFSKMERTFFFLGSAFQVFRQCGGASMRTRFCQTIFLGIWIFAKPRLICFLDFGFCPRGGGSGEESARALGFFWRAGYGLKE
jgi:hypothetical protein